MTEKPRINKGGNDRPSRRTVLKGIGFTVVSAATCSMVSLSSFGCSDENSVVEPPAVNGYGYY